MARSVKTAGPRVVVYNALPWPRSGMIEIPSQPGKFLYAEDVPANGYKTYPADEWQGVCPRARGQAGQPARLDTRFTASCSTCGAAASRRWSRRRPGVNGRSHQPLRLGPVPPRAFQQPADARLHPCLRPAATTLPAAACQRIPMYAALTLPAWSLAIDKRPCRYCHPDCDRHPRPGQRHRAGRHVAPRAALGRRRVAREREDSRPRSRGRLALFPAGRQATRITPWDGWADRSIRPRTSFPAPTRITSA